MASSEAWLADLQRHGELDLLPGALQGRADALGLTAVVEEGMVGFVNVKTDYRLDSKRLSIRDELRPNFTLVLAAVLSGAATLVFLAVGLTPGKPATRRVEKGCTPAVSDSPAGNAGE